MNVAEMAECVEGFWKEVLSGEHCFRIAGAWVPQINSPL